MTQAVIEWANVTNDTLIIARDAGEVWFRPIYSTDDESFPFAERMTSSGAPGSTVGLLDGAISLGFQLARDLPGERAPSLIRYIYSLVGAYYTSKDTPRNLLRAAERFKEIGRMEVAAYLETRAREETGHHRLALRDLSALGLPASQIVANLVPIGVKPVCDLFDYFSYQEYPIDCIGFSYCSERIAAVKSKSEVDAVDSLFPNSVDATRFLRSHSSLGSEVSHVEETIEFVSELPASDRIRIVQATHQTALLMADRRRLESNRSESEIAEELQKAAGKELRVSDLATALASKAEQ
jgi:hypothetical protein